ncbi:MAG: hypothetical protein GY940_18595 [bacterium]|nr:hypothetical protein [bacterium]
MKKNIYLILTILICVSFFHAPGMGTVHAKSKRKVKKNILTSKTLPTVKIQVNQSLKYLGKTGFKLNDSAYVERYHFAELKDKRIERILIFQFEHYLKGNDYKYKKKLNNPIKLGGLDFNRSSALTHVGNFLKKWQGKGTGFEQTYAFFDKKGYTYEDELFVHRLAYTGDDLRHKFLVMYYENLSGLELSLADLRRKPSFTHTALSPGFLEMAPERRDKFYRLREFKTRLFESFKFLPLK